MKWRYVRRADSLARGESAAFERVENEKWLQRPVALSTKGEKMAITRLQSGLAVLATVFCVSPALAQAEYPVKPVKLVVPVPPGGSADLAGRVLARKIGELLGQPMVTETSVP